MGEHVRESPQLYCEECFIGWRAGGQCGHPRAITRAEGQAILSRVDLLDRVAAWARRARSW